MKNLVTYHAHVDKAQTALPTTKGNGGSVSVDRNFKQEELNEMGYEVGEVQTTSKTIKKDLLKGEVQALKTRGISLDTCKKFSYQIGEHKGEKVQIANYCNSVGR